MDNGASFISTLRVCAKNKDIFKGSRVHRDLLRKGLLQTCSDALATMYAKSGAPGKARGLLDMHKTQNLFTWTAVIVGYAQKGQYEYALQCFEQMELDGLAPDAVVLTCVLKVCGSIGAFETGKQIHLEISRRRNFGNDVNLGNALVNMYAKCGALAIARYVLEGLPARDAISWSFLIAGYVQEGYFEEVLHCFEQMQHEHLSPNAVTFVAILKACGSLGQGDKGKKIHSEIARQGLLKDDIVLGNALVDMYVKCGALKKAHGVLTGLPAKDVVSWSALIAGYADQGNGEQALDCFEQMIGEGLSPNVVTYICVLKACGSIGAIDKGKEISDEISRQGLLHTEIVLGNALVDMYAKCGSLSKAQEVLMEMPHRDIVSWSALIAGYAHQGQGKKALSCYAQLQDEGLSPNEVTFLAVLKACGSIRAVDDGEQVHVELVRWGLVHSVVLGTALIEMYAACGVLQRAQCVLMELPGRDEVSWSTLIEGYAQHDQGEKALQCFKQMQEDGLSPDAVTFSCILKACGAIWAADKGEVIHKEILRQGLLRSNEVLGVGVVDMYAKCGALEKAQGVLDQLPITNVVTWCALISGYAQRGLPEQALSCFDLMQREGLYPDGVTYMCILEVCGSVGAARKGEQIHDQIVRQGLLASNVILANALVDMYTRCGELVKAQRMLEELHVGDVDPWSTLIARFAQQDQGEEALICFDGILQEDLSPDEAMYACILKACGIIGATDRGERVHNEIVRQGLLEKNTVLGTALVGMYAKCGAFANAARVLRELPSQDVASWNALITEYAHHGLGEQALNCFDEMQCEGLCPNAVTFSCVLDACCHVSHIHEAERHFVDISTKFGITPEVEHYTCMVDLFGRAGHLDRAIELIQQMPNSDNSTVAWSSLLGACEKWGGTKVGSWAFEHALCICNTDAALYSLMAACVRDHVP